MPIPVTCPGCHTRFRVSDKFAGKDGACPKCKGPIHVPELKEEVVVHAPDHSETGAVDSKGQSVLKPIKRRETKFKPLYFVGILAVTIALFVAAWFLRAKDGVEPNTYILILGAALLGPPIAWAGYFFLRDPELEPYLGKALWLRATICGLVYAVLWVAIFFVKGRIWGSDDPLETFQMLMLAVPFVGAGMLAAYASLDIDPTSSFMHYALYLLVTILLRATMGLSIL